MLTKPQLRILERCFDAEVQAGVRGNDLLAIVQYGRRVPKGVLLCLDAGLVERKSVELPGRFRVVVSGYVLTDLGRIAWCSHCDAEETPTTITT